jgi:hypothetical protein
VQEAIMRVTSSFLWISLLTSLIFFGCVLTVLIIRFATPPEQEYLVGEISLFPPADYPYSIDEVNNRIYLVNTGKDILIFHWLTPGSAHCRYKWHDRERVFIDPCYGTQFTLDGSYLTGPPRRGLDRYAVRLEAGQIIVDLSNIVEGSESP